LGADYGRTRGRAPTPFAALFFWVVLGVLGFIIGGIFGGIWGIIRGG
jgi:hypothetical protein